MSIFRTILDAINGFQNPAVENDEDERFFKLPRVLGADYAPGYGIPKRPSMDVLLAQSRKTWIPPGQAVSVAGRLIPGGMLYVGSKLGPIAGWEAVDPALIDASLPTSADRPGSGWLSYQMSYTRSEPYERGRFLDWLAQGQRPGAPVHFGYLKFYGIERRMLFDARHDRAAQVELPLLIEEAQRLARLYDHDRSFKMRVADLLIASYLLHGTPDPEQVKPQAYENSWSLPFSIQAALGIFANRGAPLPSDWACTWIISDPNTNLRTPAIRCREEFQSLFQHRYRKQFGAGMTLKPPKPCLQLRFSPASPTFGGHLALGEHDLPDLNRVRKPQAQLRVLVDQVTAELDSYSRTIGMSGERFSPMALAARPIELGDISGFASMAPLAELLRRSLGDDPVSSIDVGKLLDCVPGISRPPTQKQATAIGLLAQRLGYGFEPDPSAMRKAFIDSERVGLYRRDPTGTTGNDCSMQLTALALCSLVARVDGTLDAETQAALLDLVATAHPVAIGDTFRLAANMRWLAGSPVAFADAKRRWIQTNGASPDTMAQLLVQTASRDGDVSVAEMQLLSRIYALLGRSDYQLHTDLHQRFAARSGAPAPTPADRPGSSSRIGPQTDGMVALDVNVLRRVHYETADIQSMLDQVFADDDTQSAPAAPEPSPDTIAYQRAPVDSHMQLIVMLAERPSCTLAELTEMARSLGLMAAGTIETINERAVDLGLDPPIECDEECAIDSDILKELLAHV